MKNYHPYDPNQNKNKFAGQIEKNSSTSEQFIKESKCKPLLQNDT